MIKRFLFRRLISWHSVTYDENETIETEVNITFFDLLVLLIVAASLAVFYPVGV